MTSTPFDDLGFDDNSKLPGEPAKRLTCGLSPSGINVRQTLTDGFDHSGVIRF